jgi:hypothetical protein
MGPPDRGIRPGSPCNAGWRDGEFGDLFANGTLSTQTKCAAFHDTENLFRSDAAHPSFRRARESQFPEFPRPVANLLLSSLVVRPCFRGIGFLLLASFELPLGADAIFFWM